MISDVPISCLNGLCLLGGAQQEPSLLAVEQITAGPPNLSGLFGRTGLFVCLFVYGHCACLIFKKKTTSKLFQDIIVFD